MAHLEMSLTEPFAIPASELVDDRSDDLIPSNVDHWADAVDHATEPCIVIDAKAVVAAASEQTSSNVQTVATATEELTVTAEAPNSSVLTRRLWIIE